MFFSIVTDFKFGKHFKIMAITQLGNRLKHPVTADYERQWKFYRVFFIGTWHLESYNNFSKNKAK